MHDRLHIGLAQFDIQWENPNGNIQHLQSLTHFEKDIDLLLLPEMWSTGFSMEPEKISEQEKGPALQWMIGHSAKLNLAIAGSISTKHNGGYYNRFYFVHPDGRIDHYDKKHLFSYGKEDRHYSAGKTQVVVEYKGWKIFPIICYDLRFPVWCRNNTDYDIMIVVANWPVPRIHHWDVLLKARAIENQCYVAAVNRIGADGNGLHYPGHSSVVDMNGNMLLEMKDKEGISILTLEKQLLNNYRAHFRFLQDKDQFIIDEEDSTD